MNDEELADFRHALREQGFEKIGYNGGPDEYSEGWAKASTQPGCGPIVVEFRWSIKQ